MPADHYLTRRTVLCAGGAGAAGMCAFVLTGCNSGSSSSSTATSAAATSAAAPPTSDPASSMTTSSPASASGGTSASSSASGKQVAKVSDIPVGGSISATLDGKPIILAQPTAGKIVAFTAICTHQGCTVNPDGATLECPCHGSTFDAFTGQNTGSPAPSPLAAIPVTVSGRAVFAGS
jgi:cytochrome b6-f complex iron-sulfur subunit